MVPSGLLPVVRPVGRRPGALRRWTADPGSFCVCYDAAMSRQLEPIEFVRGDTKIFEITLRDKNTQAPVDLTGSTVTSQIRETADSASALATATCTLVDATGGVFRVVYSAASTAALAIASGRFDIQIAFADGTVRTIWPNRKAKVVSDVTK